MKCPAFYALALTLVLPLSDGMADPKKNDIFGFGRKRNEISNALFPGGNEPGSGPAASAEKPKVERDSDTIFRGGKPKKLESAAYTIKDGEKIEKPIPEARGKGPLFSMFRKGSSGEGPLTSATSATSAPVAQETPRPNRILPPIPSRKEKEKELVESAPGTTTSPAEASLASAESPDTATTSTEEAPAPAFTAVPMEKAEEKKSDGLFSFFSREKKKVEPVTIAATPVVEETADDVTDSDTTPRMVSNPSTTASAAIPGTPSYEERAPTKPAPEPAPSGATDGNGDVPTFVGAPTSENTKAKKGFGIPNPIEALKPDPKPVSLVGAETIIENGEIVGEQEDIVESNIVKMGDDKKEPPRIVNGVKTYSSWDDVEGRNVSAADRIISQMRSN